MSSEEYILQANDLGVNAFTTTKKYKWQDRGNPEHVVYFSLSRRMGWTSDMLMDTVANFLHAAKKLWANEFTAEENFINRLIDTDWPMIHGEARVNIFGDLPVDGGRWKFSVNICNEFTSAQTILNGAAEDAEADENLAVWDCKPVPNGNGKPKAKPTPQQQKAQPQAPPVTKSPQQTPDGITVLDYDYKQKAAYEAKYANQLVAIPFAKLRRAVNAKKDGTGSYECLEFYGWYDGRVSKYPLYNIFAPKEGQKWSDWKTFYDLLKSSKVDELSAPGQEWEQPGQLVIKIDKKEKGTYWNLKNVIFDGEYIPSDSQSDMPDWGKDEQPAAHEIPWDDGDPDNDPGRHLDM